MPLCRVGGGPDGSPGRGLPLPVRLFCRFPCRALTSATSRDWLRVEKGRQIAPREESPRCLPVKGRDSVQRPARLARTWPVVPPFESGRFSVGAAAFGRLAGLSVADAAGLAWAGAWVGRLSRLRLDARGSAWAGDALGLFAGGRPPPSFLPRYPPFGARLACSRVCQGRFALLQPAGGLNPTGGLGHTDV